MIHVDRHRSPLPAGTVAVGVGLLVLGVTSYGFLVVCARALGPARFAPLSVLWAVVFLSGPGCFLPFEQEISRRLAASPNTSPRELVRVAATAGCVLLVVLTVLLAATAPITRTRLFDGQVLLLVGLELSLAGYFAQFVVRGLLSGRGEFGRYGAVLAVEGAARLAVCLALLLADVRSPGPYGLSLGIAPLVSIVPALGRSKPRPSMSEQPAAHGTTSWWSAIGFLLVASLLSQVLVNSGPIAVKALATVRQRTIAGQFLAGLVIARVPLFLFQAVQAALLPGLAAMAGADRLDAFRSRIKRLVLLVGGLGAAAVGASLVVGPSVVHVVFGRAFTLGRRDLALLALGNILFIVAIVFGQALIALARHAWVAPGWGIGVVAFAAGLLVGRDLLLRVEVALVIGCGAAATVLGLGLVKAVAHGAGVESVDHLDVVEAAHLPLEP